MNTHALHSALICELIRTVDAVGADRVAKEWPDMRLLYNQAKILQEREGQSTK